MMMFDKNGKIFGKINIIDFCVVLAVIVGVIGILGRFVLPIGGDDKDTVKTEARFSYVLQVDDIRSFSVDAFEKKGPVMNIASGETVGEIIKVEHIPYRSNYITKEGKVVQMEIPESYSAMITVESEGYETEEGFFIKDDTELVLGSEISMITKYVNLNGVVKSVEKIN